MMNVGIQGIEGSFHHMAATAYWNGTALKFFPASTFDILGKMLAQGDVDVAVMAIENSIAGTLLQNYRILREFGFSVHGEIYFPIKHHLLVNKNVHMDAIKEVISHPMALNQCKQFLNLHPEWRLIEDVDTALSAKALSISKSKDQACIASSIAANAYGLTILKANIHSHIHNYTRFFIVKREAVHDLDKVDKASIFLQIPDKMGQLLKVLSIIHDHKINLSKLQSYPVEGSFRAYYFHIDLEFGMLEDYIACKDQLCAASFFLKELGLYKRHDLKIIDGMTQLDFPNIFENPIEAPLFPRVKSM